MKRLVPILIIAVALVFAASLLVQRPKRAMENEGTVADWMPDEDSPAIEYGTSGFEVIHAETDKPVADDAATMSPRHSIVTREIYGEVIKETFQAKAIRVVDGDTIELLLDDKSHPNFRLASIDAPEKKQPFGSKATEALKEMCIGKEVTIHQTGVDGYQRPIAFVSADGLNLNAEMIRLGFAWHYKKYSASSELTDLESEARDAKRGLWVDVEAIEQWAWRSVN